MNTGKYIFSQLIEFLPQRIFDKIVMKYEGNKYVKHFTCWNQLLVMMFGQLSNRESLRDLTSTISAHSNKAYHLGFGKNITRSNLSKVNERREPKIFEDFAYHMIGMARKKRVSKDFEIEGQVYAFDATTIDLCLNVFWWAKFRKKKGGIKVHTLYDVETQIPAFFHITTASVHDSKTIDKIPYEPGSYYIFDRAYNNFKLLYLIHQIEAYFVVRAPKNLLADMSIELTGFYPKQYYPEKLRLVRYWDEEQKREFVFLTNAMDISALQVAELYKNRWQVELFFKWLKQHLKIKKFWGTTENAVRIQIYAAICAYCLVAIIQHDMKLDRSTYEVLQILSISLTDKTHLKDLFNKTNFQYDKERCDSNEPSLFDF